MKLSVFFLMMLLPSVNLDAAPEPISLSGIWKLALDPADTMIGSTPDQWNFNDSMALPGTTDLAGKGPHVTQPIPFNYHLNREYVYTGAAYYSREITIPADWKGV